MKIASYKTLKEDVFKIELPIETSTYKVIKHQDVIEGIMEQIDKKNIFVSSEIYRTSTNGNQLQGEFRFKSGIDKEIDMGLIFQNSYDRSMSLKIVSGAHCWVCSNGQCYGSSGKFLRRHTGEIQVLTPLKIIEQIDLIEKDFSKAVEVKNRLKEIELTKQTVAELVGRLYVEESLLQTTQLSILKSEIDNPSFDYGVENTAWNLFSNITHSYKGISPRMFIDQNIKLSNFFIEEFS